MAGSHGACCLVGNTAFGGTSADRQRAFEKAASTGSAATAKAAGENPES